MAEGGYVSFSSGSQSIYDFFCEVCEDESKHLEAHGYCEDCKEYLCEDCFNAHKKPRSTRYHVLKDKNSMPKDTSMLTDRVNKNIGTRCKSHRAKLVEFYCNSHKVFGCSTCFATEHKHCTEVESIQEKSNSILDSNYYKKFLSKLTTMKEKADGIIKQSGSNTLSVQKCCSDFVAIVYQTKDELIRELDEDAYNMELLAHTICSEDEGDMKHLETECKDVSTRIEHIRSKIEDLQSTKRASQLYIEMKEKAGEVNTLEDNLRCFQRKNVVRKYKFDSNCEVKKVLKSRCALGKLSFLNVQPTRPIVSSHLTASKVVDISVTSKSDTAACAITGSAILSNTRVVIADENNSKVKLVDIHSNKLIADLQMPSRPWDITVVPRNKAAVTLPDSGKILLLKVKNKIEKKTEICVGGMCYGVAYIHDMLAVTIVGNARSVGNSRLKIIDLRGNVIRDIEKDSYGCQLFMSPLYVCVGNDCKTIYVSDDNSYAVASLTMHGTVRAVYEDNDLKSPRKLCADQKGNIFVCGFKSVHIITADCRKIKVILLEADGLDTDVLSVSYCQDSNRLFIGMKGGNYINVFKISYPKTALQHARSRTMTL